MSKVDKYYWLVAMAVNMILAATTTGPEKYGFAGVWQTCGLLYFNAVIHELIDAAPKGR